MIHTKIDQTASIHTDLQPRATIHTNLHSKAQIKSGIGLPDIAYIEHDIYNGPTTIIPSSFSEQELYTKDKLVKSNITVTKIPYYETSNETGTTVYIGNEELIVIEGGN